MEALSQAEWTDIPVVMGVVLKTNNYQQVKVHSLVGQLNIIANHLQVLFHINGRFLGFYALDSNAQGQWTVDSQ